MNILKKSEKKDLKIIVSIVILRHLQKFYLMKNAGIFCGRNIKDVGEIVGESFLKKDYISTKRKKM